MHCGELRNKTVEMCYIHWKWGQKLVHVQMALSSQLSAKADKFVVLYWTYQFFLRVQQSIKIRIQFPYRDVHVFSLINLGTWLNFWHIYSTIFVNFGQKSLNWLINSFISIRDYPYMTSSIFYVCLTTNPPIFIFILIYFRTIVIQITI